MLSTIFFLVYQVGSGKSQANLADDSALDWLKPRTLLKPDDQEEVPDAVSWF